MTYVLYVFTFMCLLVFQTTIMPYFRLFDSFYDMFFPFVIYLGLFRSTRESIPVIITLGYVMDNLSGAPFGVYLTTYLWLFAGLRWITTVLHVGDNVLLPFVVAAGALLENLIFMGVSAMYEPGSRFSSAVVSTVAVQVLWALCIGSIFIIVFNYLHQRWDKFFKELLASQKR